MQTATHCNNLLQHAAAHRNTFSKTGTSRRAACVFSCSTGRKKKFSEVSSLLYLLCKITVELNFEKFYVCPGGLQGTGSHCNADRNTLQHTAMHCNTLQHATTRCNTLQHAATHCDILQRTATHCNILQRTARHCNTLQHTATHYNTLQHTATHCNTL